MVQHRALIVEDDHHFRELLAQLLQEEGYVVETADSILGVAGLIQSWRPSVVLLDLGLPYRSGASLLADLRGNPLTKNVPVLVVTAQPEALTPERRAMVDDVIEKPPDIPTLLEAVRAACERGAEQSRRDAAKGPAVAAGARSKRGGRKSS
jgi:DNA-binding response OmpR family regulator